MLSRMDPVFAVCGTILIFLVLATFSTRSNISLLAPQLRRRRYSSLVVVQRHVLVYRAPPHAAIQVHFAEITQREPKARAAWHAAPQVSVFVLFLLVKQVN